MTIIRHLLQWGWPIYIGWWTGSAGISWTHPAFWLLMIPAVLVSTVALYHMDRTTVP